MFAADAADAGARVGDAAGGGTAGRGDADAHAFDAGVPCANARGGGTRMRGAARRGRGGMVPCCRNEREKWDAPALSPALSLCVEKPPLRSQERTAGWRVFYTEETPCVCVCARGRKEKEWG